MKQLLKIAFFLVVALSARAQELFECQFTDPQNVKYTGLLVYFNEEKIYMRVGFNTENRYQVVNIDYHVESGTANNDKHYFALIGQKATFITSPASKFGYTPDHLIWFPTQQGNNEIPFVTSNLENVKNTKKAQVFRQLNAKNVTDTYLRSFYGNTESDYLALKKLFKIEKTTPKPPPPSTNTNTNSNTYANTPAKLHLIVIANTGISDIGQSCMIDKNNLNSEFRGIAQTLKMGFQSYILQGDNFTKENLQTTLQSVKPSANDVVVFVYRGHGYRFKNQTKSYPQLDMRYSNYQRVGEANAVNLEEVYYNITAKGARLNIVLADCCNNVIGLNQMTSSDFMAIQSNTNFQDERLARLFLRSSGNLLASSSSPGEVSWANNANGGFFTVSFIQALREEIGYFGNTEANWQNLMNTSVKSARYKTSKTMCSNCTQQNGIFYSTITYR